MVSTRTRSTLLLAIPLGAGLLILGSFAFDSPDAARRPAPFALLDVRTEPHPQNRAVAVEDAMESIELEPARDFYLETVLMQGAVGDKKAAILSLRKIGDANAIETLSFALGDTDPRVRKAAIEALSRIGGDDALAAIASAAIDDDLALRSRAVEALAFAGYSAPQYLELALRDEDPRIRATAVDALGDIGDSRSINIISAALRDPDADVRQRAVEVMDQLDDEALFHVLYPPR